HSDTDTGPSGRMNTPAVRRGSVGVAARGDLDRFGTDIHFSDHAALFDVTHLELHLRTNLGNHGTLTVPSGCAHTMWPFSVCTARAPRCAQSSARHLMDSTAVTTSATSTGVASTRNPSAMCWIQPFIVTSSHRK